MGVKGGKHYPSWGGESSQDRDHLLWGKLGLGSSTGEGWKHLDSHWAPAMETAIWGGLGTKAWENLDLLNRVIGKRPDSSCIPGHTCSNSLAYGLLYPQSI